MPTQESYDKMNLTEKKSAGNGELGNFLKKKNTALRGINIRSTLSKMAELAYYFYFASVSYGDQTRSIFDSQSRPLTRKRDMTKRLLILKGYVLIL